MKDQQTQLNINHVVGHCEILFITLDTLRYDIAQKCWKEGTTPNLGQVVGPHGWEMRHSPGSFTYAAHQAFFAGFLPTPEQPGKQARPFAVAFPGSETISRRTCTFDTADIITGFRSRDYYTICIGGVGFFNKMSPLGSVMPNLFDESHWTPDLGVTSPRSTENQVNLALDRLERVQRDKRLFLFLNVSAIHQPNCIFAKGAQEDSPETHALALQYVDRQLPPLLDALKQRAPVFVIICSDHGTAYGEDGYWGHRLGHPIVYTVPYTQCLLTQDDQ